MAGRSITFVGDVLSEMSTVNVVNDEENEGYGLEHRFFISI